MKLNKIILSSFAATALVFGASCTDEVEYTPTAPVENPSVYFSPTSTTTYSIIEGTKSFNVPVYRADATEAQTAEVSFTVEPAGAFSVDPTVTFEAESNRANIAVNYTISELIVAKEYKITLTLKGVEPTPYTLNELTVTCSYVPWQPIIVENEDGTTDDSSLAWYRDDFIPTLFSIDPMEWQVYIEEHPVTKGLYRLVDPYMYFYTDLAGGAWYDDESKHYMVIDASQPDAVIMRNFWSGYCINTDYGECVMASLAYLNIANGSTLGAEVTAGNTGTLVDGYITFPKEKLLFGMELYNDLGLYYANKNGMFKVVLPGYENEPEWEPYGWCKYTDGLCSELAKDPGHSYEVYVEASTQNKGIYRIVNLFGPESGYVTETPETPVYTVIDASNKNCVLIGVTPTPFRDRLKGQISVTTEADIMWDSEDGGDYEAIEAAGLGGTLKNNKISIPGSQVRYRYRNGSYGQPKIPIEVVLDLNNPRVPEENEPEPESTAKAANMMVVKGDVIPVAILDRMYSIREK